MQWLISAICVLTAAVHGGGGVTKTPGLSPFWTDDYKVFEQIYGKTSDRELFGSTLPPNQSFGVDLTPLRNQASEKKERYIDTEDRDLDQQPSLYSFDNYNNLLTKQNIEAFDPKPTKTSFKFIPYNDFTPISQSTDPATYNYYKTLELLEKKKKIDALKSLAVNNFAQFSSYATSPEDTEGYKSIQDILDAHEGNKGNKKVNNDHENLAKYVSYGVSKSRRKKPASNPRFINSNDLQKPRCVSGRCRQRNTSVRVRTGPVLRKIKHTIISD
ncbi:uncharacterized protein LOC134651603 [Cydia amplana]|uniref:uncharacterized protein LOC134651603 n=1 Tax=Cydia amplana TaxID=1869771 RepID=UPI002FE5D7C4